MPKNTLERLVFVPATDLGNLVQNPTVRASSSSSEKLSIQRKCCFFIMD